MFIAAGMFVVSLIAAIAVDLSPNPSRVRPQQAQAGVSAAVRPAVPDNVPVMSVTPLDDLSVAAMVAWNRAGGRPARIGVVRQLSSAASSQSVATRVSAPNSDYLRVGIECTAGDLWITGADGEVAAFACNGGGVTWSPTVSGPDALVQSSSAARVSAVAEIISLEVLKTTADDYTWCLIDAACAGAPYGGFQNDRAGIARIDFISGANAFTCSGGLLNDDPSDFTPYFLTANHCISTSTEASSVEAFWDYSSPSCGASAPPLLSVPHTVGATLMTTSAATDVTLLRLSSVPGRRTFLGWWPNGSPLTQGNTLYRVSHGEGLAQRYSTTTIDNAIPSCAGWGRPNWILSRPSVGATAGGSSGSPVFVWNPSTSGSYVVGQLSGRCAATSVDNCSGSNVIADGSLAASWAFLQPFLRPGSAAQPPPCAPCTPSSNVACLLGNRFKATLQWRDSGANLSGIGSVVRYSDNSPEIDPQFGPVSETAFFSFYSFAPKSVETFLRMLNGHGINDKYWIFVGGFTGSEYTLSVQDTKTCATWQRTIASGATTVMKDFSAFPLP